MKLVANTRFLNILDGNIYDKGDTFNASDADAKYLIDNKICSEVKGKDKPEKEKED